MVNVKRCSWRKKLKNDDEELIRIKRGRKKAIEEEKGKDREREKERKRKRETRREREREREKERERERQTQGEWLSDVIRFEIMGAIVRGNKMRKTGKGDTAIYREDG